MDKFLQSQFLGDSEGDSEDPNERIASILFSIRTALSFCPQSEILKDILFILRNLAEAKEEIERLENLCREHGIIPTKPGNLVL